MKLFALVFALALIVSVPNSCFSQEQVEISGVKYILHTVTKGETVFNLCQKYKVSQKDLMQANPGLTAILKAGSTVKVPVATVASSSAPVAETASAPVEAAMTKYKVERGETLFSLAARFGVEVSDIKKANPLLYSRSLESGETILIPQQTSIKNQNAGQTEASQTESATGINPEPPQDCAPVKAKNQKYKAALLLPLYLSGNDNPEPASINKALLMSRISIAKQVVTNPEDTAVVFSGGNVDQKAVGFLEFYEGALLAVDSLQRNGMNIELYVFDVSNQKMINALLQMDEFREMNLIVGPVYPEIQETVASFAAKNRIPMISPLASTGNFEQNNSWYFKVNPGREYQLEQTARYVGEELHGKNFIMLRMEGNSTSADAQLAQLCKEKLTSGKALFHEYNLAQQGINSLTPVLTESGENIFFIPTDNEAQVSVAVTNLVAVAEHHDVVLMGTQMLTKLKSIQTENYHRIRLRYLSPYFVDYKRPQVRRFVGRYREVYAAEPTPFSFQGFDVAYYFLSALHRFGKDFRSCLPHYPMELTQMNFSFGKVAPMGGFANRSLFVTSYERNFDVLNLGAYGKDIFTPKK